MEEAFIIIFKQLSLLSFLFLYCKKYIEVNYEEIGFFSDHRACRRKLCVGAGFPGRHPVCSGKNIIA
jgi:hypothetical protein